MSDEKEEEQKPFCIDRAKSGRSTCKKCRIPIDKGELRIGKLSPNPFGSGMFKAWHHVHCMFEVFTSQRASTRRIQEPENDISDWSTISDEDKAIVMKAIEDFENADPFKALKDKLKAKRTKEELEKDNGDANVSGSKSPEKKKFKHADVSESNTPEKRKKNHMNVSESKSPEKKKFKHSDVSENKDLTVTKYSKDDMFLSFQKLCDKIAETSSYLEKTEIFRNMFTKGMENDGFKGDLILWCKLLLPDTEARVYRLHNKMLIKLFSRIFGEDEGTMLQDLEEGDVSQTIKTFYQKSTIVKPKNISDLSLQEVNKFLEELSQYTTEQEQIHKFKSILSRCTADDLKMIIRLIKHDLRMNAGPKHVLDAIDKEAYTAFRGVRNLAYIVKKFTVDGAVKSALTASISPKSQKDEIARQKLMTPMKPMLAQACNSVNMAFEKFPNGMFSEIKYDGERVQIHKKASAFLYYSRALKPVSPHKVKFLEDYIPKAFPEAVDLILDAEILLIDTKTSQPLPFGSLGIHKKTEFEDANVCLFIFDILYYNNKSVIDQPLRYRRNLLETKMTPIKNRVVLSEIEQINDPKKLAEMIVKVFKLGLEGLVLKCVDSKYEPGKRYWLKIKKDYLFKGAIADSADLVVIGAWYGYGHKGGIMSIFLMGCYDPNRDVWLTVTKVHGGLDDATLTELQNSLDMVKISKEVNLVPKWLKVHKTMVPDFVAKDPKKQPVWEITGAQFSNQGVHTADGISIRFPRVTRIRDDKDWETATNLQELRELFNKSTESMDYSLLLENASQKHNEIKKRRKTKEKILISSSVSSNTSSNTTSSTVYSDTHIDMKKEEYNKDDSTNYVDDETIDKAANISEESENEFEVTKHKIGKSGSLTKQLLQVLSQKTDDSEHKIKNSKGDYKKTKAKYYSFVNTDYIEYNASGSPLNWVPHRIPPKILPKDATPISNLDKNEIISKCILSHTRVYHLDKLNKDAKITLQKTLKTWNVNRLGSVLLDKTLKNEATHVIHSRRRVPVSIFNKLQDIPKKARHVHVSWLEETIAQNKVQNDEEYAVELEGQYCTCCSAMEPGPSSNEK